MFWQALRNKNIKSLILRSWSISWPMTCIMFFVFLIGLSDVYVAGRISKEAQAAYGLSSQLYFIFSIIAFALTAGTVSVISRLFSSSAKDDFSIAVDTSFISAIAAGILLSLFALAFSGSIIHSFNVPQVLKGLTAPLIRIYSFSLLFNYLLLNTNGILRSCGRIKQSLLTMAVVSLLNIGLNFTLSFGTPLGFKGIAVATGISTLVGCFLNLLFLKNVMTRRFKFSLAILRNIFSIGWPAGVLQVFWQLSVLALFLIISALPENNIEILAAFTNGLKIESVIFLPAFAFNMASAVVVGNLLGKNNQEDAFSAGIVTALAGVMIVSALTVMVMCNGSAAAALISNNDIVIRESIRYIYIALLSEPVMAWGVILAGGLNGAGDTRRVMAAVVLSVWLVRVPLSYLLGVYFKLGAPAIWWSMNFSVALQAILITKRYFSRKWFVCKHIEPVV